MVDIIHISPTQIFQKDLWSDMNKKKNVLLAVADISAAMVLLIKAISTYNKTGKNRIIDAAANVKHNDMTGD